MHCCSTSGFTFTVKPLNTAASEKKEVRVIGKLSYVEGNNSAVPVVLQSNPQGEEKVSESGNKTTGTMATPAPPVIGTVATPAPSAGTAAEPENQPVPVSVIPVHKKKYTRKAAHLVRD
ncbi:hypothetical protein QYF61_027942 [Mycteria americana]|uniref:Uncharacterized protein n=1 Tax=Mycteria americana TaxID=33587 RepID=A0AAN7N994_MYCAM|nr:hypothetical protein QYF61_027942 [Mycteria americana]